MAVFTPVSLDDARHLLTSFDLGDLHDLRGIPAGIENTNYFLDTDRGHYVLTLFEVLRHDQLPFYIELMHHLAQRGLPVPQPQTLHDGTRLTTLHGKPCAIVTRLPGRSTTQPDPTHCALTGETLARMHLAAHDYPNRQGNLRGLAWWQQTVPALLPFLNPSQTQLIQDSLDEQVAVQASDHYRALPTGPSHCDLFRDNVLFHEQDGVPRMGGFIDFYFAGWDTWLFDVAVAVNDWCVHPDGRFDDARVQAWLRAYAARRPFQGAERAAWPALLRAAALRFWVSRLYDFHLPRPAETLAAHDPAHFERILMARHQQPAPELP